MLKAFLVALPLLIAAPSIALAQVAANPTPQPGEKLKCKRSQVTGSLARTQKICLTERQWRGMEDGARKNAQDMQGQLNSLRDNGESPGFTPQ